MIPLQNWDNFPPPLQFINLFLGRRMRPKTDHVKEVSQAEMSRESQIVSLLVTLEERSRMFNLPNSCTIRQERAHVSPSHRDRCA